MQAVLIDQRYQLSIAMADEHAHWAERFLSSLYWAISDRIPGTSNVTVNVDELPLDNYRLVMQALVACAETGTTPTLAIIREIAAELGYTRDTPDHEPDLIDSLELWESSGAGVVPYARIVIEHARKRHQITRLLRALDDYLEPLPFDNQPTQILLTSKPLGRKRRQCA